MGSPTSEYGRGSGETQHTVTLTRSFWMQATEVTNAQYAELAQWALDQGHCTATASSLRDALVGSTAELLDLDSSYCEISSSGGMLTVDAGKEDHPVQEVTWFGAAAYCDWLSLREGLLRAYDHGTWQCNDHAPYSALGYRLPTEAEWEYACRAGTTTPFHTGDCLDAGTEANYRGDVPYSGCPSGPYAGWTVSVGSYPANAWGLHDMHGNLWEWCNDWIGSYGGAATDPAGPVGPDGSRVIRGGDWEYNAQVCRSANREFIAPAWSFNYIGFRPVRSVF
jgi:formylglycine-generating enzyme required for sulfatase activity